MLSDVEIVQAIKEGSIIIDPRPQMHQLQPASVDVHLGTRFGQLKRPSKGWQHLSDPSEVNYLERDNIVLHPGKFLLGQLKERLTLDASIVARIEGKSSIGRKGIAIHVTAGFVDPGWDGYLTIEMFNASDVPYMLRAGDPIAQLAFDRLETPSERPYGHPDLGSHYQGSEEVKGSYHSTSTPVQTKDLNDNVETNDISELTLETDGESNETKGTGTSPSTESTVPSTPQS